MEDEIHGVLLNTIRPFIGVVRPVALENNIRNNENDPQSAAHDKADLTHGNGGVVLGHRNTPQRVEIRLAELHGIHVVCGLIATRDLGFWKQILAAKKNSAAVLEFLKRIRRVVVVPTRGGVVRLQQLV